MVFDAQSSSAVISGRLYNKFTTLGKEKKKVKENKAKKSKHKSARGQGIEHTTIN